jgi:hypothetical protein
VWHVHGASRYVLVSDEFVIHLKYNSTQTTCDVHFLCVVAYHRDGM